MSGALLQSSPVGCGLVVGARVGSRQSADDQVQVRAPRASIFRGIGAAATSAGGRSLGAAASALVEGWKGAADTSCGRPLPASAARVWLSGRPGPRQGPLASAREMMG